LVNGATTGPGVQQQLVLPPPVQAAVWSTDALPERERFPYWRDAVCRTVFNVSIEAQPEQFFARMSTRRSGVFRFATTISSGTYELIRAQRDISRAPADHYTLYLQLSGQTVLNQSDGARAVRGKEILFYDERVPFRATLMDGVRTMAVIPRAMIDRRAPWLRRQPVQIFAGHSPYIDLARRHLVQLGAEGASLGESATALLMENVCNLLALAGASDVPTSRLEADLQIEAMLAFCRQRLHDPALSPQMVADHLGISLRTLHSRFRRIGSTFGRWVLESRLDACRTALRDASQRALNISDIAYRWGFNDLSHFNKTFRQRFDCTPGEWRNERAS
jgi:AraC family transcriptional regulator, positive regulator of tynA and feaB